MMRGVRRQEPSLRVSGRGQSRLVLGHGGSRLGWLSAVWQTYQVPLTLLLLLLLFGIAGGIEMRTEVLR